MQFNLKLATSLRLAAKESDDSTRPSLPRTAELKRLRITVAKAILVASLFCGGQSAYAKGEDCERMDASETEAPDARWIAHTYGKICDIGIMTSGAVLVDLARPDSPDTAVTVLSIDMPSDKTLWPKVRWDSPRKLSIQLPPGATIALQMANFQGIEIQVRFCPSNPAVRDEWLKYRAAYHKWIVDTTAWNQLRSRDPNAAGSKPVQPTPPEGKAPDSACEP